MHRVELKVQDFRGCFLEWLYVPNAPCGVERSLQIFLLVSLLCLVPNAPCGVERIIHIYEFMSYQNKFLMHRVELKGHPNSQRTK